MPSEYFRRIAPWLFLLVACVPLVGCGNKTYPVEGQVVFDDGTVAKELAGYLVMFQSEAHKTSADGLIQADGTFKMSTATPGDGAMLGTHRIAITPPLPDIHKGPAPVRIAAKYGQFDTSALTVEIKAETNRITLKVERAEP